VEDLGKDVEHRLYECNSCTLAPGAHRTTPTSQAGGVGGGDTDPHDRLSGNVKLFEGRGSLSRWGWSALRFLPVAPRGGLMPKRLRASLGIGGFVAVVVACGGSDGTGSDVISGADGGTTDTDATVGGNDGGGTGDGSITGNDGSTTTGPDGSTTGPD